MGRYASATIWLSIALAAALIALSFALSHYGIADIRMEPRLVSEWVLGHGLRIALIIFGASIVVRAAALAITALEQSLGYGEAHDLEWKRRASTLGGILVRLVTVIVWFVGMMMVLRELTIDVMPILTGAGIVGLAVGFGAQNLVRDVISGFFMILEDQVRVGDNARINGIAGQIEQVNLRTIVLRDGEGAVHVFPNGTITALANLSKQFSFAIVDVRITDVEHIDRTFAIIRDVGAAIEVDPVLRPFLFGSIDVTGVEAIDGGTVTIRAKFRTQPLNQGRVASELRRRLVLALCDNGIRPYAKTKAGA